MINRDYVPPFPLKNKGRYLLKVLHEATMLTLPPFLCFQICEKNVTDKVTTGTYIELMKHQKFLKKNLLTFLRVGRDRENDVLVSSSTGF